jgi:site-specific DNA recombinase
MLLSPAEAANGQDKSGRVRIRCSAAKESSICPDAKTFYLNTVERAVLGGLRAEMRAPKVIAEYVRTYLDERKRPAASSNAKRQRLEQQLGQLSCEIDRLVDAIAKGYGDPAVLGPRSSSLDAERKRISEELKNKPPTPKVVALHPAILKRYEEQLLRLEDAPSKGASAGDTEAAEAIRDLAETVTVFREPQASRWCSRRNSRPIKRAARRGSLPKPGKRSVGKGGSGGPLHRETHYY